MTGPATPGRGVDPFPESDPLVYDELSPAMVVLRALMAVMADTGATVSFPAELAPSGLAVEVAAGWQLRPTLITAAGQVVLSCAWQAMPQFPTAGQS